MQTFSPIWLTSDTQLQSLDATFAKASLANKLLTRFEVSDTAPQLRGVLLPWARAPLVFRAAGELVVHTDHIQFAARRQSLFGWRLANVDETLTFTLQARELVRAEPYSFSSPVARLFDLPFVRLHTTRGDALGQVLLCVGAKVNKRYITEQTARLLTAIQTLMAPVAAT